MNIEPMITVRDVAASSRFYQRILGAKSGHGGDEYEQIKHGEVLVLQLHHRDAHEHPHLINDEQPVGNGVVLWFRTPDFDAAVTRIRDSGAAFLEEPHVNPLARHRECMILDPDGYKVGITSPYGDVGDAK